MRVMCHEGEKWKVLTTQNFKPFENREWRIGKQGRGGGVGGGGMGAGWEPPSLSFPWRSSSPTCALSLPAALGMQSWFLTLLFEARALDPASQSRTPPLWLIYSCHNQSLSEVSLSLHASEPLHLHLRVPQPGRLFPPGKFPLTLQGSVKSHLLQEVLPDSPSPFEPPPSRCLCPGSSLPDLGDHFPHWAGSSPRAECLSSLSLLSSTQRQAFSGSALGRFAE